MSLEVASSGSETAGVLRRNIYIISRQIGSSFLASSAASSEGSRDFFNSYASEFDDTEGDPPRGKAAPPLSLTHWGLRVGRGIYNCLKTDDGKLEFKRILTTVPSGILISMSARLV